MFGLLMRDRSFHRSPIFHIIRFCLATPMNRPSQHAAPGSTREAPSPRRAPEPPAHVSKVPFGRRVLRRLAGWAGMMPLKMGAPCVPRVAGGVARSVLFSPPFGGGQPWVNGLRRDAAHHTPEACAPHFPRRRSGLRFLTDIKFTCESIDGLNGASHHSLRAGNLFIETTGAAGGFLFQIQHSDVDAQ